MELKFRCYNSKTKQMLIQGNSQDENRSLFWHIWETTSHMSEPEMWTGLLDKNGKEIYCKDRIEAFHDEAFVVEWFADTASWVLIGEETGKARWIENREHFKSDFDFSTNQLTVIGNVHESNEK